MRNNAQCWPQQFEFDCNFPYVWKFKLSPSIYSHHSMFSMSNGPCTEGGMGYRLHRILQGVSELCPSRTLLIPSKVSQVVCCPPSIQRNTFPISVYRCLHLVALYNPSEPFDGVVFPRQTTRETLRPFADVMPEASAAVFGNKIH